MVLAPDPPKYTIVAVNDSYLSATNTQRDGASGIVGRGLFEVFPDNPDDAGATGMANLKESLRLVLADRVPHAMAMQKYDIARPASAGGGFEERFWSPINVPFFGPGGEVELIIHHATDVTEVARLAREAWSEGEAARGLRSQVEWLKEEIQRRRMAEDEMAATTYAIAHDLRSPLRALDGYAALVSRDPELVISEQGRGQLLRIRAAAQRMGELMDGLLSLARLGRGLLRTELVDIAALARAEIEELSRAEPDRRVRLIAPDRLLVTGDDRLLGIVVHNLIANGWKFTRESQDPVIEIGAGERDGESAYYVRDNGVGFEPEHGKQLFRPFHRLRPDEFEGTGIGLATVRRVIERHNGRVWAEGVAGAGATVWFTLEAEVASKG